MSFSKNLKNYRILRELSSHALAKRAELDPKSISAYEEEESIPRIDSVQKIASALSIPVQDLLYDENAEIPFNQVEYDRLILLSYELPVPQKQLINDLMRGFVALDKTTKELERITGLLQSLPTRNMR
ncbi:MAG: helix-turn-helix transcriptional regulator [Bacteroidota bacterium]